MLYYRFPTSFWIFLLVLDVSCVVNSIITKHEGNSTKDFGMTISTYPDNKKEFETYNPNSHGPSISCIVKFKASLRWEFCNENSKIASNSSRVQYRQLEITLHLRNGDDPGEYCYKCIAEQDGYSQTKKIFISRTDELCKTPSREEARKRKGVKICAFFPKPSAGGCPGNSISKFKMRDTMNALGETEIILSWTKPYHKFDTQYGYKFSLEYSKLEDISNLCIITKYDSSKNYLNITKIAEVETTYTMRLNHLLHVKSDLQKRTRSDRKLKFKVSIYRLPLSQHPIVATLTVRHREELCEEYFQKWGSYPSTCEPFQNITIIEGCTKPNPKSRYQFLLSEKITLKWRIKKDFHWQGDKKMNTTHIKIWFPHYLILILPINQTLLTIKPPLNFHKERYKIQFIRFSSSPKDELIIMEKSLPVCPATMRPPRTTVVITIHGDESQQRTSILIVMTTILLTILVLVIIVKYWYKRVRKDVLRIMSPMSSVETINEHSEKDIKENMIEVVEHVPTVMLVYPHGCKEVESLVVFIASQLNTFGVKVLSDIIQTDLVAEKSLPQVLIQSFTEADYVVVFCTEKKGSSLPCHRPYEFVLNQLISNACVYNNTDQERNCNRFLAVHFSQSGDIPSYLLSRSYQLPLQFSTFVQNLFGVKTHFSYLYTKIFEQNVPQYMERKRQLQMLTENLNGFEHRLCHSTTCLKGKISESLDTTSSFTSHEEEEQFENIRDDADTNSLHFSSTDDEEEIEEEVKEKKKKGRKIKFADEEAMLPASF